jgi:23S rRNA-/tRNA-specific pseudouridylate synthase
MSEPTILLHEGSLVAVAKPAGWVVHPARPDEPADLRAWLAEQPGLPAGLDPIHRLDRETSGVVLYAADPALKGSLGIAFAEGRVHKTYLALVIGRAHQKGVIRTPLSPDHPGPPQAALTRYRLHEKLGGFSLLRVNPETGRKHQVRRHLHGIGLPLVGDSRYPPPRRVRVPGFPGRLWLHAWRLELPDGRVIEAPLPPELEATLVALRAPAP